METIDTQIKKNAAISGLLLGAISFVLSIFLYYFITGMTTSFYIMTILGPLLFSVVIPIILAILFCNDLRKKIGGYWDFRQAVTGIFIMFLVSYLVSFTGNQIFVRVIEPNMVEKMKTALVNSSSAMMEKQGLDQDKIDKQVAKMDESFDAQKDLSVGKTLRNFGIAILLIFVVSLIFAAFYKREPPLFAAPMEDLDATV